MSNQQRVSGEALDNAADSGALSVTVVFTTIPATLEALREGGRLAHGFRGRIRVLVPSVVPYPLDLTRPLVDPLFRLRHFRTLWDQHAVETFIDVRLCRDRLRCIRDALTPHSLVLIGARTSFWPSLSDKLLVRQLRDDGHEVILIRTRN
jgi:hypothetical protein